MKCLLLDLQGLLGTTGCNADKDFVGFCFASVAWFGLLHGCLTVSAAHPMSRALLSWGSFSRCLLHALDTAWPAAGIRLCSATRSLHTSCSLQQADASSDLGTQREAMDFDVAIVGAGPAGLSAAIRVKQRSKESEKELSVCVVEKGAEVGERSSCAATPRCTCKRHAPKDCAKFSAIGGVFAGSHILSGNVLETRALDELLPDWKDDASLNRTPATRDSFYFLTQRRTLRLPTPPQMRNKGKGNQIVSLRQVLALCTF